MQIFSLKEVMTEKGVEAPKVQIFKSDTIMWVQDFLDGCTPQGVSSRAYTSDFCRFKRGDEVCYATAFFTKSQDDIVYGLVLYDADTDVGRMILKQIESNADYELAKGRDISLLQWTSGFAALRRVQTGKSYEWWQSRLNHFWKRRVVGDANLKDKEAASLDTQLGYGFDSRNLAEAMERFVAP